MGQCWSEDEDEGEEDAEEGRPARSGVKASYAQGRKRKQSRYRGLEQKEPSSEGVTWEESPLPKSLLTMHTITGPFTVAYVCLQPKKTCVNEPKKRYILFMGERHIPGTLPCAEAGDSKTIEVQDWLHTLCKDAVSGTTMIDTFLEVPFREEPPPPPKAKSEEPTPSDAPRRVGFIERISKRFPRCLDRDKGGCPFKDRARFHYVDVRRRDKLKGLDTLDAILELLQNAFRASVSGTRRTLQELMNLAKERTRIFQDERVVPVASNEEVLKTLVMFTNPGGLTDWVASKRRSVRAKKQQEKMCDAITAKEIASHFDTMIWWAIALLKRGLKDVDVARQVEILRQVWEYPNRPIEVEYDSDWIQFFKTVIKAVSDIGFYLMNEYTISRMVSRFDDASFPVCANSNFYGGAEHVLDMLKCVKACPSLRAEVLFQHTNSDHAMYQHCIVLSTEDLEKMRLVVRKAD